MRLLYVYVYDGDTFTNELPSFTPFYGTKLSQEVAAMSTVRSNKFYRIAISLANSVESLALQSPERCARVLSSILR